MNFKKNMQDSNIGFQLAPMVDIVFLLLIFFMVASVFSQWETKIGIKLPTSDSGIREARMPGEIIVNIDNENKPVDAHFKFKVRKITPPIFQIKGGMLYVT